MFCRLEEKRCVVVLRVVKAQKKPKVGSILPSARGEKKSEGQSCSDGGASKGPNINL